MTAVVTIVAEVGEKVGKNHARYVLLNRIDKNGQLITDKIPVIYWCRTDANYFMTIETGTCVVIKGRLEYDADLHLVVIAEFVSPVK